MRKNPLEKTGQAGEMEASANQGIEVEIGQALSEAIAEAERAVERLSADVSQSETQLDRLHSEESLALAALWEEEARPRSSDGKELVHRALEAQQAYLAAKGELERLAAEKKGLSRQVETLKRLEGLWRNFQINADKQRGLLERAANMEAVLTAQEAERQRMAKRLESGPIQTLSNFMIESEIMGHLVRTDADAALAELEHLDEVSSRTLQDLRDLVFELYPASLGEVGLVAATRDYADVVRQRLGLPLSLHFGGPPKRLAPSMERLTFRTAQAFLGAVALAFGDALPTVEVSLNMDFDDEGVGLAMDARQRGGPSSVLDALGRNLDLQLAGERIGLLGGSFSTSRPADGESFVLRAHLPNQTVTASLP
jgi:signal transduction histidine kinase